ncbi:outer membrane lipoprotein-sorting protein [Treponema phagedenis]|uniref:outer membrane lipoprotein-sorting protein n=1 Tax=Treponema phagedenis TaxID=162 RepID=UPI000465A3C5|nr:outer membrane lipoprotein-sorting protein [Treponema phagedenis]NVP24460.1 outer membrane lipoprotein-sorting protein [Treponema phagedenis]QEJ95479.1 outer membrane lipoprotein-sorting protein [Treponema phagedenis]QKS92707.1 outer membrane lipoprotein-sorting protein [Treponema phagedenis]QLC58671.1 outer membrane lipoprotein-sorting protein [Treponema phagedenis]
MKKKFFALLIGFCAIGFIFADDAAEIMKQARKNADVDSVGTQAEMHLQNNGKTVNILKINQYTSKNKSGDQRTFIAFTAPANVRGTRFLTIQKKKGALDQRIFLPSLGKVRRIAGATEGTTSFMGTDFSYNDISFMSRDLDLDVYKIVNTENFNGKDCNVIESVPKDTKYEYSKTLLWIEKGNNRFWKAEFYDKKGAAVKRIELSNYKTLQGIDTPMTIKLTTLSAKTSTLIKVLKMQYNMEIPEKVFTAQYLELGK